MTKAGQLVKVHLTSRVPKINIINVSLNIKDDHLNILMTTGVSDYFLHRA